MYESMIVIGRLRGGEGGGDLCLLLLLLPLTALTELRVPTTEALPHALCTLPLLLGSFLVGDLILLLVDLQVQVKVLQVVGPAGDQLCHLVDSFVDSGILVKLLISTALHNLATINKGINST